MGGLAIGGRMADPRPPTAPIISSCSTDLTDHLPYISPTRSPLTQSQPFFARIHTVLYCDRRPAFIPTSLPAQCEREKDEGGEEVSKDQEGESDKTAVAGPFSSQWLAAPSGDSGAATVGFCSRRLSDRNLRFGAQEQARRRLHCLATEGTFMQLTSRSGVKQISPAPSSSQGVPTPVLSARTLIPSKAGDAMMCHMPQDLSHLSQTCAKHGVPHVDAPNGALVCPSCLQRSRQSSGNSAGLGLAECQHSCVPSHRGSPSHLDHDELGVLSCLCCHRLDPDYTCCLHPLLRVPWWSLLREASLPIFDYLDS